MGKNIIFCADGTWTAPGVEAKLDDETVASNVYQLFIDLKGIVDQQSLLLANEQEKTLTDNSGNVVQVAKYIYGMGDPHNGLIKRLGGAFGADLIVPIIRGYTFISRHWQAGDRIYLVGFSHGAYTARVLAEMIIDRGLLSREKLNLNLRNKEEAWRFASSVWAQYLAHSAEMSPSLLGSVVRELPGFFCDSVDPTCIARPASIEAVAVWETVGQMGIPKYFTDKRYNVFRFNNTELHPRVKYGLQALAIDEQRVDLSPVLWDNRDRILQVMFPGIHQDVGGGYSTTCEDRSLSNGAYLWMHDALDDLGINLAPSNIVADPLGPLHCDWYPPTRYLRINPRQLPPPVTSSMMVHQSVIERLSGGSVLLQQSAINGEWQPGPYMPQPLQDYLRGLGAIPINWAIAR
ncbi:phospholipase effector Tle1 domain-containing protein [Buttiauxella sp.]|uniref:phospholipase effector Tle1 domain-containing protein n=1 Tax=Buttiauxella sp. TaxID=1972222 RepID=UPI003C7296E4